VFFKLNYRCVEIIFLCRRLRGYLLSDLGSNCVFRIAWQVFNWDIVEYNKQMGEMEESEFSPTPDHLMELKLYLESPREYQESLRKRSGMTPSLRRCSSNEGSDGIKVDHHNHL
jgi:hypothetical protein